MEKSGGVDLRGGVCTQCAKTTSSTPAPKPNRNTLSILNIKSVLGSYTDLRRPKTAKFFYGQDNLQLKSPKLCLWSEHGGGEVGRGSPVTRTDYFKEGYGREGMSWNLVDRADMLSEASSALNSHMQPVHAGDRRDEVGAANSLRASKCLHTLKVSHYCLILEFHCVASEGTASHLEQDTNLT